MALYVAGDRTNDVALLGYVGKYLWFYNAANDGGIEARNPANMQVTVSRKRIQETKPAMAGRLSTPEDYEANQFYAYDYLDNRHGLTDMNDVVYELDHAALIANPSEEKSNEKRFQTGQSRILL